MMTYMGWQISDMKAPLPESIRHALNHYAKKYAEPPNVLEHSNLLSDVPNVDGVEFISISIPKNIFLIGVKR